MTHGIFTRALIGLALFALASAAAAVEPVNTDRKGVALHGYDVVAYFDQAMPVRGSEGITHTWNGATWRFSTASRRDRFAADPESFAPRYGGYCAKAVSENHTADVDPKKAWKIVDGKLYLNYDARVQRLWEEDIPRRIADADRNWPGLVGGAK